MKRSAKTAGKRKASQCPNPLKKLCDKYTAQNDGQLHYRVYVALARILMDLQALTQQEGIDFDDVLDKAVDLAVGEAIGTAGLRKR